MSYSDGLNFINTDHLKPQLQEFGISTNLTPMSTAMPQAQGGWADRLSWLLGGQNDDGSKFNGVGGLALGALGGIGNLWMGAKQLGLAKDSLRENRRQFDLNYGAQKSAYNNQLEGRAREMAAANPNAQPVAEYMKKWGI